MGGSFGTRYRRSARTRGVRYPDRGHVSHRSQEDLGVDRPSGERIDLDFRRVRYWLDLYVGLGILILWDGGVRLSNVEKEAPLPGLHRVWEIK